MRKWRADQRHQNGSDVEYMAGVGKRFLMLKDVNTCYDAWELGSMYENLPVELDKKAKITVLSAEFGILRVEKRLHDSEVIQIVRLDESAARLDFSMNIRNWQEKYKMLKVSFPVNAYANEAYHETQVGYVKRRCIALIRPTRIAMKSAITATSSCLMAPMALRCSTTESAA